MFKDKIYHRIAAIVTLVLFGLMLWDILGNNSQFFVPLLVILCVHLFIELVVIMLAWFKPEAFEENAPDSEFRRIVVYERAEEKPAQFQPVTEKKAAVVAKPPAPAKKAPAKKPAGRLDYRGDVHEVVDLEGVGPTYAKRLMDAGIVHTQHLLFASDARIVKLTGAPKKTVQQWKEMSQFVKVSGIGPQYAEALARAGLTFQNLRTGDPARMASQVKTYLDGLKTNVIGSGIGTQRIQTWQNAAKKMRKAPIDLKAIVPLNLESKAAKQTGVAKKVTKAKPSPIGRKATA